MNLSYKNKIGFSIIEILIGISILTIGIFGVVKMFPYGLQISKYAENNTLGVMAGQEKMENTISAGYENIGTGIIEAKHKITSGSFGDTYNFFRETEVIFVDADLNDSVADTGMKKITVEVSWQLSTGEEKNIILNKLISRR
ncbi:hypothetical protein ACFL23_01275 [Patescibacteria group bacterium]